MQEQEIKKLVGTLLAQGRNLNDIHKILTADHQVKMTFMDLRLLSSELDVDWKQFDPAKPAPKPDEAAAPAAGVPGATTIELSKITRPGARLSGSVTFASGHAGEWFVDSYGQLSLSPDSLYEQLSEEDMIDFQKALRAKLGGGR